MAHCDGIAINDSAQATLVADRDADAPVVFLVAGRKACQGQLLGGDFGIVCGGAGDAVVDGIGSGKCHSIQSDGLVDTSIPVSKSGTAVANADGITGDQAEKTAYAGNSRGGAAVIDLIGSGEASEGQGFLCNLAIVTVNTATINVVVGLVCTSQRQSADGVTQARTGILASEGARTTDADCIAGLNTSRQRQTHTAHGGGAVVGFADAADAGGERFLRHIKRADNDEVAAEVAAVFDDRTRGAQLVAAHGQLASGGCHCRLRGQGEAGAAASTVIHVDQVGRVDRYT